MVSVREWYIIYTINCSFHKLKQPFGMRYARSILLEIVFPTTTITIATSDPMCGFFNNWYSVNIYCDCWLCNEFGTSCGKEEIKNALSTNYEALNSIESFHTVSAFYSTIYTPTEHISVCISSTLCVLQKMKTLTNSKKSKWFQCGSSSLSKYRYSAEIPVFMR